MKMINSILFGVVVLISALTQQTYAALPLADSQGDKLPTLAPMLERTLPAVVNIATSGRVQVQQNPLLNDPLFRHFFQVPEQPRERQTQSLGSGVIVDAQKGYIITNNHVIHNADVIHVKLADGRHFKAKLIGTDPETDIAVIKIEANNLTALPFADSDRLRVGDFVVAIGSPFGLGQTVTSGIVSALGRSGLGIERYEDFIQTDASINTGNSGGALVNLRGELVGINTAIISQSGGSVGIGFAIPINMVRDVMQQLIEHGEVKRGRIGAQAQDINPDLAQAFDLPSTTRGAIISQVTPGLAADKAGLRAGDIVLEINGKAVKHSTDLRNFIGLLRVGKKVKIKVLRDGKELDLVATIQMPQTVEKQGKTLHKKLTGAHFGDIPQDHHLYGRIKGVMIVKVEHDSTAAYYGLRPGDVIISANRKKIKDLDQLKQAIKGSGKVLLNIIRGNAALYLVL